MFEQFIPFLASFFATMGFAILYNAPARTIIPSGLAGMTGWFIFDYFLSFSELGIFFASGIASFSVAIICQLLARQFKMPVIVFSIPGIIPLVPGGAAYTMMRALVEGNGEAALLFGTQTFLVSGAIALGLSLNSALFQIIQPYFFYPRNNKRP